MKIWTRALLAVLTLAGGMLVIHCALNTPAIVNHTGVMLALGMIGLGLVLEARQRHALAAAKARATHHD